MKILYLSRWFPYPADNGSKIRTAALLAALAADHEVDLISFVEAAPSQEDMHAALTICRSVQTAPYTRFDPAGWKSRLHYLSVQPRSVGSTYSPAFAQIVREAVARRMPDVVIAGQIDMVPYATPIEGIPRILEELEMGTRLAPPSHAQTQISTRLSEWKLRHYVRNLLPHFSAVTVVSEPEARLVREIAPDFAGHLLILPNGVHLSTLASGEAAPLPEADSLLYPGAVTYSANLDAVRYFGSEILPRILAVRPDVRLRVTGGTGDVDLGGLPPEIGFTGRVPSVTPLLRSAWAVVVPLRIGGGSRIKVLEAMAHGTPVVSTQKGVEGLQFVDGRDGLVAEGAAAFAEATLRLLGDGELRSRLAENGPRIAAAYDWNRISPRLGALVEEVAANDASTHDRRRPTVREVSA